jgi:hypothetical protein
MSRNSTCFSVIFLGLLLALHAPAQQLDRDAAKDMLNKLGAAAATSEFVLSPDQDQHLHTLTKDLLDALQIQSDTPCLLMAHDPRVRSHEFVVCNGLFPPGLDPHQPAFDLKLGKPFAWHVLTISFPDATPDNPDEQIIQYTWEYDFSSLPSQLQQVLSPATPRSGRSLFRLDAGTWSWVAYR